MPAASVVKPPKKLISFVRKKYFFVQKIFFFVQIYLTPARLSIYFPRCFPQIIPQMLTDRSN